MLIGARSILSFFLYSREMETTNHVVFAILKFLDDQQRSPDLTPDAIESLEGNCMLFNWVTGNDI